MDGLSGAASVIQVIQLSAQVLGALKTYYEVVRDCREDLARLYDTIRGIEVILKYINGLASDVKLEILQWCFNEATGPVRRLHQELRNLEKKLASWKLDQTTTKKKLRRATKYLKWPLLKCDIGNSTRVIREQCSILTLELGLGSLSIQSQTIGILDELRNDIEGGLVSNRDSLAVVEAIKTDVSAGRITQSEIVGIITKIDTTTAEKLALQNQSVTILEDIKKDIAAAQCSAEFNDVLNWLDKWTPSPSLQHNPLREQCVATTGTWLLDGDEFKSWIEADNSFMWINGGAGSGKSVLCSTVIDHLQKHYCNTRDSFPSLIYWYFAFDNVATQDLSSFLCYLVRALCSGSKGLPQAIQEAYAVSLRGSSKPPTQTLKALLKDLLDNFDDVYLVIDALDEYPQRRDSLFSLINEIRALSVPSLHFLVTSRREGDICSNFEPSTRHLGPITEISVQGEHVRYDIEKYMDIRLASEAFNRWTIEEKSAVKVQLAAGADGMFRLVALQLDTLSEARNKRQRQDALVNVPRFLDSFYERDLAVITSKDREIVRKALLWILFSARPLTLAELAEALIIDPTSACVDKRRGAAEASLVYVDDDDRLDVDRSLLEILPASIVRTVAKPYNRDKSKYHGCVIQSLKTKPYSSSVTVQFSHYSVQEYLLSDRNAVFETPISVGISQALLADSCIAYAHYMSVFPDRGQNDGVISFLFEPGHDDNYDPPKALGDEAWYALRKYVRKNWTRHIRAARDIQQPFLERMLAESFSTSEPLSTLLPYLAIHSDRLFTMLEYPVRSTNVELYPQGAVLRNCMLVHFSRCGSNRNLRLLLEMADSRDSNRDISAWLNTTDGEALQVASLEGHIETVEILLEAGFDCNGLSSRDSGHALQAAALNGHQDIVALILNRGANIDHIDKNYGTALRASALSGHNDLVNLLLEHGANVNVLDIEHGYALQAAVFNGHINIASTLIEHGANINVRGGREGSPLEASVAMGHVSLVEFLLSNGASPNRLNNPMPAEWERLVRMGSMKFKWSCPLEAAAEKGDPRIVALLLKYGAGVDYQHKGRGTALQAAVHHGYSEIVALLIENGANVNSTGGFGSVLAAAAAGGQSGIMATLIAHGAKINSPENGREGELHKAVRSGNLGVVTLLLEHGADINQQCGISGTALNLASHIGQERKSGFRGQTYSDTRIDTIAMIDLLMKYGADANAQGGCLGDFLDRHPPGSVLHAAATISNTATIKSLIRHGADVNAYGGRYGYALQSAAMRGEAKTVSLLLENGAETNSQGGYHGTALAAAVSYIDDSYDDVIRALLKHGANPNVPAGDHASVLQAYVLGRNRNARVEVTNLLIEHGADVNAHCEKHGSVLQSCVAVSYDNDDGFELIEALILQGADIHFRGGQHCTVFQAAVCSGSMVLIHKFLGYGHDVNEQGGKHGNALQAAIVEYTMHQLEVVTFLLEAGADVNAEGGEDGTALHATICKEGWAMSDGTIMSLLIQHGADVHQQTGKYGYPLQHAAHAADTRAAEILLDAGADINAQGGCYGTALQAATLSGDKKCVNFLLQQGANVHIQGGEYGNALQAAIQKWFRHGYSKTRKEINDIIDLLLAAGAEATEQQILDIARIGVVGNVVDIGVDIAGELLRYPVLIRLRYATTITVLGGRGTTPRIAQSFEEAYGVKPRLEKLDLIDSDVDI
ncbi:hypothetical protein V495_06882 [Pseudogymnoascus sp. VKM F-4514 (FW-929)]|nr:hypothetical protein V495_06882 [Pseudogymnoascus sp. VKM F-4514 (FW-929)]KFY53802.1 hypothetical protein V497_08254 [Pseudogymnoascus sp. VKM F-4516 (FW-969)]